MKAYSNDMKKIATLTSLALLGLFTIAAGSTFLVRPVPTAPDRAVVARIIPLPTVQTNPKLRVALRLVDDELTESQPIRLRLELKNHLDSPVTVNLGDDSKDLLRFTLMLSDGTRRELSSPVPRSGLVMGGNIRIPAHGVYLQQVLLNEWAELREGDYMLGLRFGGPVKTMNGATISIEQDVVIPIKVMPKQTDHLAAVAESIALELSTASDQRDVLHLALALTYVDDASVVPHLQMALASEKLVDSTIINALRKRGSKNGVDVLSFAMTLKNKPETKILARSALQWLEHYTQDLSLKQYIKEQLRRLDVGNDH